MRANLAVRPTAHRYSRAEAVRRTYDLFGEGKIAEAVRSFDPHAVWHFPGSSPFSGHHVGREAIKSTLFKAAILSDYTVRSVLVDLAEGEKFVVAVQQTVARRHGKSNSLMVCNLFTVRGGLVHEVTSCPYDLRAHDEFWR